MLRVLRRLKPAATVALLLVLSGCWSSAPKVESIPDGSGYEIPVIPGKIETPDVVMDDKPAPDMIITVQPETPGAKPVKIQVRKVKRTVVDRLLTNKPEYEVKSDAEWVTAVQPKKTLWYRWGLAVVLGLFILAVVAMVIINKLSSWSPWGFVKNLFKR